VSWQFRISLTKLLQTPRQLKQISQPERRAALADDQGRIRGDQARPRNWQNPQAAGIVVVVHLIGAPVVALGQQLKRLPELGMKGVSNLESSGRKPR
jgi:hypothetical protein